ncbi:MAG: hypothetical protein AB1735_04125 [Pseudomonadota bacterium]
MSEYWAVVTADMELVATVRRSLGVPKAQRAEQRWTLVWHRAAAKALLERAEPRVYMPTPAHQLLALEVALDALRPERYATRAGAIARARSLAGEQAQVLHYTASGQPLLVVRQQQGGAALTKAARSALSAAVADMARAA